MGLQRENGFSEGFFEGGNFGKVLPRPIGEHDPLDMCPALEDWEVVSSKTGPIVWRRGPRAFSDPSSAPDKTLPAQLHRLLPRTIRSPISGNSSNQGCPRLLADTYWENVDDPGGRYEMLFLPRFGHLLGRRMAPGDLALQSGALLAFVAATSFWTTSAKNPFPTATAHSSIILLPAPDRSPSKSQGLGPQG